MNVVQNILVYVVLAMAIAYLVKKFILPKSFFPSKKKAPHSCGNDDCGCH